MSCVVTPPDGMASCWRKERPLKRVGWSAALIVSCVVFGGCSGTLAYTPPNAPAPTGSTLLLAKRPDEVWQWVVSTAHRVGFIVERLDNAGGVIELSYRGNPEPYVDCGRVVSQVSNLRGKRTYRFPAAASFVEYEFMTGQEIVVIDRSMQLESQVSVRIAARGPNETHVWTRARYLLKRILVVRDTEGRSRTTTQAVQFDSGQSAAFAGAVTCVATGRLEQAALPVFLSR